MDMTLRPVTGNERLYCYPQSEQLLSQTGCIGHLSADFGADGTSFRRGWVDDRAWLASEPFRRELNGVIRALQTEPAYGECLRSRGAMTAFCWSRTDALLNLSTGDFGFRADTPQHSYLLRMNPARDEASLCCYCYRRDWLDHHLAGAERGIRFPDAEGRVRFRIPDGGRILITEPEGSQWELTCRYVDDFHTEIGSGPCSLWHVTEFAERMERDGNLVQPMDPMPECSRPERVREAGCAR